MNQDGARAMAQTVAARQGRTGTLFRVLGSFHALAAPIPKDIDRF